jgi:hypothetical protein
MIHFQCKSCGKQLAVQDSRAGTVGACPRCKGPVHVPRGHPSPEEQGRDSEDAFPFSRWGLRKALLWYLCFHTLSFLVGVAGAVGFVLILLKEPLSIQMILQLATAGCATVAGLCYWVVSMPNWRLFFASTIPSSTEYVVTDDRLVRYASGDRVVEEVPFANITHVRLVTRRNQEDPEISARILGIDLRSLDDQQTTLDHSFCVWSQKMHRHDLVLIQDFFDDPLKTVYRKIKQRWQLWQETHPASGREVKPSSRPRKAPAWHEQPMIYLLGGLGLLVAVAGAAIVCVGALLGQGKEADKEGGVPAQANKPEERAGAGGLPGLLAYWPLDEGQGNSAKDASGGGSSATLHGGEWVQGVKGTAVRLGGKSDYVDLGSQPRLNFPADGPFTIAIWFATRSNGVLCSFRRQRSLFPVIELSVRQGRLTGWVRDDRSGFGGARLTGGAGNDGKWHHAALVRQGDGTIELFLDGASQGHARGTNSGGPITTDLRTLGCDRVRLAQEKAPGFLAGSLDEICVYHRPLSQAEIVSLAARKQ